MKKIISITALLPLLFALSLPVKASANSANADMPSSYLEKAISKLPKDKAEEFRDAMQQAHEQNADLYDQVHQLHEDMHNILTGDTFDKNAFIAKSGELRQVHDKIGVNLDEAFASAVDNLSASERKSLGRALKHEHEAHQNVKKAQ